MVQGLAFLSKKSWHTKNKANQERVWLAEQKKEQETAKANQLAREIQQEREAEELNRIAGKNSLKDRGIEWMYHEGTSNELAKECAAKKAEEYLMGKEYVGEVETRGDSHDGNQKGGIYNKLNKTVSVGIQQQETGKKEMYPAAVNSVQYRNENFRMKIEDPMFLFSQKEREKKNIRLKSEALYHRVVGSEDEDQNGNYESSLSSTGKNKSKKEKKRKGKKHQKKRKKKSSRHRCEYDERQSLSHCRKRRRHTYERPANQSRSSSYDRHEELSRGEKRGYDSSSDSSHNRRHRSYDYKDTRKNFYFQNNGKREFLSKREENRMGDRYSSYSTPEKEEPNIKNSSERVVRPGKVEVYGLKGALLGNLANRDIGPCKNLILKKREEQQDQRTRNLRISRSRKKMTDDERTSALLQMKVDARKREIAMDKQPPYRDRNNDDEMKSASKNGASFLNKISTRVNGITAEKHPSLSSRVSQNRHTNQRLHHSFL